MKSPLFSPTQLTVITTDNCNARCSHCVMCCSPGKKHSLTFKKIRDTIKQLEKINPISLVVFSGGEPTLLKDDLLEALAFCSERGIFTRIVTNAHWAKSHKAAYSYLRTLREWRLDELNIRTDDLHTPYIPFEYVKNAFHASKGMGFSSVVIANSHSKGDTVTPEYIENALGEKLIRQSDNDDGKSLPDKRSSDSTCYILSDSFLQRIGRAAELDEKYFKIDKNDNNFMCGCHLVVNTLTLSPKGNIWACCGIVCENNIVLDLGNPERISLKKMLKTANDNMLLNALHLLGPMFLKQFVLYHNPKISFKKKAYSSVCEVCQDLTENKEAINEIRKNYSELIHYIIEAEEQRSKKTDTKIAS